MVSNIFSLDFPRRVCQKTLDLQIAPPFRCFAFGSPALMPQPDSTLPRRTPTRLATVVVLLMMTASAWAAPRWVTSGRLTELDATVLAADSEGPISALDVLLYLDMARHPSREVPAEYWVAGYEGRPPEIEDAMRDGVEEYLAARALAREAPEVEIPEFLERRLIHAAAQAAWVELAVVPEIVVEDEDVHYYYIVNSEQYTSRRQTQVRYVFMEIPEGSSPVVSSEIQSRMDDLRERILGGEITLEAAARLYSDAPSGKDGGLIPPFSSGEYFPEFERNAFGLVKVGDMSPVFLGPGGVYLLQLVAESTRPERRPIGEVEDDIRAVLRYAHVEPYYRTLYGKLAMYRLIDDFAVLWEYIDRTSPVARVERAELSRDQLLRINPSIIGARYDVRGGLLSIETESWIEGELILQELERLGESGHRLVERARRIAAVHLGSKEALRRRVDWTRVDSPESALDTLRSLSPVASGVPEARVIRVLMLPDDTDPAAIGRRALIQDTMRRLSETVTEGYLPTRPEPTEFAGALTTAAGQSDEAVEDLVATYNAQLDAVRWPDVRISIEDLGWIEALPGLSRHPVIPTLAAGEVSLGQTFGSGLEFFLVGAIRSAETTPWVEFPLVLQVSAYETEIGRLMREEIARVRQDHGPIALP
jgi:hypothetical protein